MALNQTPEARKPQGHAGLHCTSRDTTPQPLLSFRQEGHPQPASA